MACKRQPVRIRYGPQQINSIALVVQWIERLTPNEQIEVRFLSRAQKRIHRSWVPCPHCYARQKRCIYCRLAERFRRGFLVGGGSTTLHNRIAMSSLRITKVNELIRKELGEIMERELSLKPGVFITIAKVDTSRDLRYTRMFVSVFPLEETQYVTETLKKELGALQKALYKKLYMKPLPKLSFEIDTTEAEADKVEKILKDLD